MRELIFKIEGVLKTAKPEVVFLNFMAYRHQNDCTRGITVVLQTFKHSVYPHLYGDVISKPSLLDLLFNCGHDSLDILEGKLCKV